MPDTNSPSQTPVVDDIDAGLGVLEQLAVGPHAPSGFRDLVDGAAAG